MSRKTSKKSQTKVVMKTPASVAVVDSNTIKTQLLEWAHAGTEQAVKKLEAYVVSEPSKELRDFADMAYNEALYMYYGANSEEEVKQFELARMIRDKDTYLWKCIAEADDIRAELARCTTEGIVHHRLMKQATAKEKEAWKYRFMEDFFVGDQNRLTELEDDIAYTSAWINEARKLITVAKYQTIPDDVFAHMHTSGDGGMFCGDDMSPMHGARNEDNVCDEDCACQEDKIFANDEIPIADVPF